MTSHLVSLSYNSCDLTIHFKSWVPIFKVWHSSISLQVNYIKELNLKSSVTPSPHTHKKRRQIKKYILLTVFTVIYFSTCLLFIELGSDSGSDTDHVTGMFLGLKSDSADSAENYDSDKDPAWTPFALVSYFAFY